MRRTLTLAGAAVTVALGTGLAANAASQAGNGFRGANGRIVYEATGGFVLVNPDGTGAGHDPAHDDQRPLPGWSSDGTKLVYQGQVHGDYDIYAMDGDGSRRARADLQPRVRRGPVLVGRRAHHRVRVGTPERQRRRLTHRVRRLARRRD